ncbi:hypothetical protein L596_021815 [Steinernema carpocapsae]|uniref:C-type lectin domain-containing protein n=2 Tax=Steinernema carpocapsae TaxID=34508 RepID=A0A4U5MJX0_STECR|nr:hypothetical protein L596_021815 [Steinernema carpocapsae]
MMVTRLFTEKGDGMQFVCIVSFCHSRQLLTIISDIKGMADESCSSPTSPMLRLLALVAATTAFTCLPGSILSNLGNPICYFANIEPMKYADARDYCLKQDASLAKLDSLPASWQIRSVAFFALNGRVDRKPNNETSMWISRNNVALGNGRRSSGL